MQAETPSSTRAKDATTATATAPNQTQTTSATPAQNASSPQAHYLAQTSTSSVPSEVPTMAVTPATPLPQLHSSRCSSTRGAPWLASNTVMTTPHLHLHQVAMSLVILSLS